MLVAGFPTHRLSVHIQRLLHRGHRVAIARQRETAAEKAHARRSLAEGDSERGAEEASRTFV